MPITIPKDDDTSNGYLETRGVAEQQDTPGTRLLKKHGRSVFVSMQKEEGKSDEEIRTMLSGMEEPWIDPVSAFGGGYATAGRIAIKAGVKIGGAMIRGLAGGTTGAIMEYPIGLATEKVGEKYPRLAFPFSLTVGMLSGGTVENIIERRIVKTLTKEGVKPAMEAVEAAKAKIRQGLETGKIEDDLTGQVVEDLNKRTEPLRGFEKEAVVSEKGETGFDFRKVEGDPKKPLVFPAKKEEAEAFFRLRVEETPEKAVNINLARIESPDDVKKVIAKVGKLYEPGIQAARRETVTNIETRRLADDLGMGPEDLLSRRAGQAFNAHEALAARQILEASGQKLVELAKKAQAPDASDMDKFVFRKHLNLHYGIQAEVSGMTAEAGRALQAFRILATGDAAKLKQIQEFLDNMDTRQVTDDMAEKIAALETPQEIGTMVRQMKKARTSDVLLEAWINGLLSGPQTHAVNTLSNSLVALWQIPERLTASFFGRILPGRQEIVEREALAQAYGMVEGFKDGLRLMGRVLKTGEPTDPIGKIEARKYRAISAESLELSGTTGRAVDMLGNIIRVPGRMLMAEDELFKSVGYRMELNARAIRQVMAEGLKGKEAAARIKNILNNPPDDIHIAAIDAARYQTFTNQVTGLAAHLQRAAIENPALRLIVPFIRTPMNIVKFGAIDRTPLGLLTKRIRGEIKAGGAQRDLALARMSLGSGIMAAVACIAAEGHITGAGPSNPAMRSLMYDTGWQPYSIRIGDTYYAFNRLEPLGILFGLAADFSEIAGQVGDGEADNLASQIVMAISKNVTSKTWLRGISELLNVMSDPDRYKKRYIERFFGTLIPTGVAQIERVVDPELRQVNFMLDQIKSRIPGYSDDLSPRRNLWGEVIVLGGGLGPDIISPVYTSKKRDGPASEELIRLQLPVSMPSKVAHGVELTSQQYDRYLVLAGNEAKHPKTNLGLKETLEQLIETDKYQRESDGPDGGKASMILTHVYAFRALAREILLEEFPELSDSLRMAREEKAVALQPAY